MPIIGSLRLAGDRPEMAHLRRSLVQAIEQVDEAEEGVLSRVPLEGQKCLLQIKVRLPLFGSHLYTTRVLAPVTLS